MSFLLSCFACAVLAQAGSTPRPDGSGQAMRLGPYLSTFSDYRRFDADLPPKPWREANDEVRDAGGHAGILKGMSSAAAAGAAGKSPSGGEAPKAAPGRMPGKPAAPGDPHGGHR